MIDKFTKIIGRYTPIGDGLKVKLAYKFAERLNGEEMISKDMLDALEKIIKQNKAESSAQEEREKNDPPDRKRIEYEGIFWRVFTKEVWIKGEKDPFIELSWGWGAGLSEEQIKNKSEDCPVSVETLILSKESAKDLIKNIENILKLENKNAL